MFDALLWRRVPLAAALLLNGCSTLDYYSHLAGGQLQLLQAREPITELLENPTAGPELKQRLTLAQQARDFASAQLALPDNGSYRLYADIQRPFVVWNVFATPEFSLSPELHCFPIAGCVAYRGFYSQGRARGAAALLKQQGLDTYLGGVEAYSTLGWFDDPILNTMLRWSDERLIAVIFHELAHQQLYVADDTAFNESFATAVERLGGRRWLEQRATPQARAEYAALDARRQDFRALTLKVRGELEAVYASALPDAAKRERKADVLAAMRDEYATLKTTRWRGFAGYDGWFARANNAAFGVQAAYFELVPAFEQRFERSGGDFERFYADVRQLAALPKDERRAKLLASP